MLLFSKFIFPLQLYLYSKNVIILKNFGVKRMENMIQIRILKESIIAEINWMFHANRMDYFQAVLNSIQNDESFVSTSLSISYQSYTSFITNLKKLKDPKLSYYHNACQTIQSLTHFQEIRIWTKKESKELAEVILEYGDCSTQTLFSPLLESIKNNEVLLIYQNFE